MINYSEQIQRLSQDYHQRRIHRDEYLDARRQVLIAMDAALNGTPISQLVGQGDDTTQPQFSDRQSAYTHENIDEDKTNVDKTNVENTSADPANSGDNLNEKERDDYSPRNNSSDLDDSIE